MSKPRPKHEEEARGRKIEQTIETDTSKRLNSFHKNEFLFYSEALSENENVTLARIEIKQNFVESPVHRSLQTFFCNSFTYQSFSFSLFLSSASSMELFDFMDFMDRERRHLRRRERERESAGETRERERERRVLEGRGGVLLQEHREQSDDANTFTSISLSVSSSQARTQHA